MKSFVPALVIGLVMFAPPGSAQETKPDRRVDESRTAVAQLGRELKVRLQKALQGGGPVEAIGVCRLSAPAIAERLSRESGFTVGRTALKIRNPKNSPDPWEQKTLEAFTRRSRAGESPATLELHEIVTGPDGRRRFRYMKAIPTGEICLVCHGTTIAPDIAAALKTNYPGDRATGFKKGDIRGAFTLKRPLD